MHVFPSVKAAMRCKKAGVKVLIASGHEGGFHTAWQPVHSMTLLPDVIEKCSDENTLVCGTGGFCDGKSVAAAGECAQRITDIPKTADMVQPIMADAEAILKSVSQRYVIS